MADNDSSEPIVISIADLMSEYQIDTDAAAAKYSGKVLTLTGGTVQGVMKIKHGEEHYILSIMYSSGGNKMYKIDCYYPVEAGIVLNKLEAGQSFSPSGTWKGLKLMNCVLDSGLVVLDERGFRLSKLSRKMLWLIAGGLAVLTAGAGLLMWWL